MPIRVTSDLGPLRNLPANVRRELGDEMRLIALDLLSEGVRLAPVKEGTLRGSGSAHMGGERIATGKEFDAEATGDEALVGGADTDELSAVVAFNTTYAVEQHERTDYAHPMGGQAKYLEDPLERNRRQYLGRLAGAARRGADG